MFGFDTTHSAREALIVPMTFATLLFTILGFVLGIAGTFNPLARGTASDGTVSISLTVSYLQACVSCTAGACISSCISNTSTNGLGSTQLSAGLAFSILSWLVEILVGLPLAIWSFAAAWSGQAPGGHGKGVASPVAKRLPYVLVATLTVMAFRAVAVGAGYEYVDSKIQSYFDYERTLPGGFSNTLQPATGGILMFIALSFAVINALVASIVTYVAQPDPLMPRQPFFYNSSRQPPVARTIMRGCSETCAIWLCCILSLVTSAVAIAWYLFANSSTNWPLPIAIIAAIFAVNSKWVADFVQSVNETTGCYFHFMFQYASTFVYLFVIIMGYITIPAVCFILTLFFSEFQIFFFFSIFYFFIFIFFF